MSEVVERLVAAPHRRWHIISYHWARSIKRQSCWPNEVYDRGDRKY